MFMPSYGDSEQRIRGKTDRIRNFMHAAVDATQRGASWDEVEGGLLQQFNRPLEEQRKAPQSGGGWSIRRLD